MADPVIELPLDLYDNPLGFSIDAGGSVTKVLYRSKIEYTNGKPNNPSDKLRLRLKHLPRYDCERLLRFLTENCDIMINYGADKENAPPAYMTGVGIQHMQKEIDRVLGVKTKTLSEMDCFAKAVSHLINTFPPTDMFHSLHPTECEPALAQVRQFAEAMLAAQSLDMNGFGDVSEETQEGITANASVSDVDVLVKEYTERQVTWPLTLAIGGSAFVCMTLHKCGRYEVNDMSPRGGRTLLSLAKMVLGTSDYFEIAEMASKGNPNHIDSMYSDLVTHDPDNLNIYSLMQCDIPTFALGKVFDPDFDGKYSNNDIAAGLIKLTVTDLVQFADLNAIRQGTKCIIFSGSFFNHPYVRAMLHEQMLIRCLESPVAPDERNFFKVLKYTGHMGAIGCWMKAANFMEETAESQP